MGERVINMIICLIFPKKISDYLVSRVSRTKEALSNTIELKLFWHIVFLPITLPLALIYGIIKLPFIWFLPLGGFYNLKYAAKQFYLDIVVTKTGIPLAVKRFRLLLELFIKGRERKVSYGEKNPDKTFYVIRPYYYMKVNELATTVAHLLFHYYRNLQQLSYALEHDWIPVVDWQNYGPFWHQEDYPVNGTTNCWEYFWKQPSDYTLEEVYQSKNVVLANRNSKDYGYIPSAFITPPLDEYAKDLMIQCPKYDTLFQLNDITEAYIREKQEALFPKNARIMGVSVRSMSYGKHLTPNHPKQPGTSELIHLTRKYMEEWKMDYIFFTCEAEETVQKMQEVFEDKLLVVPRLRYKEEPKSGTMESPLYVAGQRYQTNLDYLTEMVLLSRCTSLLAGMSGGVRTALIWNANEYENTYIFDNGVWK